MKRLLTKILPCLLAIISIFTVASCKKSTYPKYRPLLSNPDATYIKVGDYTIKNSQAYYRLLQGYGVTTIQTLIDQALLGGFTLTAEEQVEFDKQLEKNIYGTNDLTSLTEEEKTKKKTSFMNQMIQSGYKTEDADAQDPNYYVNYYKLEFKRLKKAQAAFAQYVIDYDKDVDENNKDLKETDSKWKEYYYTTKEITSQFNSNYFQDFKGIVVEFDSEKEALQAMSACGINTEKNQLVTGWKKADKTAMTTEEIVEAYKALYQHQHNKAITEATTYTYEDLSTLSSTIASKAYSLKDGKYSFAPLVFGTRYFLIYRESVSDSYFNKADRTKTYTKLVTDEEKETLDETVKAAMVKEMETSEVTSNYIAKVMLEARNTAGLKIYDEGLEKLYKLSYDAVYKALSITDYTAFATTDETSTSVVFEYTIEGKTTQVTADKMYEKLLDNYGSLLSLLYIQQYVILGNSTFNTVYNYITDTILDQEAYDEYYTTDVKEYKTAFEKGDYASSGYPTTYGWENFIRDYLGVEDEKMLIINLDSTLYTDVLANYKKAMWLKDAKDENGNAIKDDSLIQTEMEKIYNDFFSATVSGVHAYIDADLDGVVDEFAETSSEATLIAEFVNLVYTKANEKVEGKYVLTGTTISERITSILRNYKLATTKDPVWGKYKAAQIRGEVMTSASYDNSTTAEQQLLDAVEANWKKIVDYSERTITGQTLDPGYRYTKNDVTYYIEASQFEGTDAVVTKNGAYRFAVTKATAPTYISTTEKTYKPSYDEYTKYTKSSSSVSSAVASAIKTYYNVAITNLTKTTLVTNKTMEDCKALLSKVTITSNEASVKAVIEKLIASQVVTED